MKFELNKLATLALFAVVFFTTVAVAQTVKQLLIPTKGTISFVNVSATWLNGTSVTEIDWGSTENATAYVMEPINITNVSNVPVTLQLNTTNLSPSILTLTLTWNVTDTTVLQPDEWVLAELEQTVTATGPYTYTTIIRGEQEP